MTYLLTEEQSIQYLEGGWDADALEELVALDLAMQEVETTVAVVLSDGMVAFYMEQGGHIL